MNIFKVKIPLPVFFPDSSLLLLGVTPQYEYIDGKKTDKCIGTTYEVVEDKDFEKFKVKVASTTPVITSEQLESSKTRLSITFDNCFGKVYRSDKGTLEVSFSADTAHLTK